MTTEYLSKNPHSSAQPKRTEVAIVRGDGIGPEIMEATLRILRESGAAIEPRPVQMGEALYLAGHSSGITPDAWDTIRSCGVLLKAPVMTPQGGGFKSLNVTLRKTLGLFANVRPCVAYAPFVATQHPGMDLVVIRENEEDLYAGIEHRQTDEVFQCLKLVSRPGSERIVRYAFEYAVANGRQKVTAMSKDNIMKLTDGIFHKVFDEIAQEYPQIATEHRIIDIGMARAATRPETFDVIVTPNLYGDILSDVTAEVAGSVGLAPSANIGTVCSMFEAIHGSAPDIVGQDVANPSGLLLAAVMMLVHLGQGDTASIIHNAWLRTIEDGVHTADVFGERTSQTCVGTQAFASAVVKRLGMMPQHFASVDYSTAAPLDPQKFIPERRPAAKKEIVGLDVFASHRGDVQELAKSLQAAESDLFELVMITNRGVMVWPKGFPETFRTDHWRCRFMGKRPLNHVDLVELTRRVAEQGVDFIKTENLCTFDGEAGYSMGQGQ